MQFFYTLGIYLFAFLLRCVAPFHKKAKLWVDGRKNVWKFLEESLKGNTDKVIWIHVSSLGEFEQGRPLIEKIKEEHPQYKIVLSFFSPSGYEIRKNYELADVITYLPIDTARNARRFFDIVKPSKVFFVKYDFWYHYLHESHSRGIPTYLISAIFRENQLFFKPYGGFYRKILHFFTTLFVQEQASADLLASIGLKNVVVAGDTRVDRVATLAENVKIIPYISEFKGQELLLVAGSSWQPDEELLIQFFEKFKEIKCKIIFAPHEVHSAHIQSLKKQLDKVNISSVCYSEVSDKTPLENYRALIIDSIGLLSSLYQYADISYIGGGFGTGIHNTLEPATFGLPVIFGKKYKKFNEAVSLVEEKGAFAITEYGDFEKILQQLITDTNFRQQAGQVSKNFITRQKGAVLKVFNGCF